VKREISLGRIHTVIVTFLLSLVLQSVVADEVEMQNGDHYVGKVVLMNSETVVLQNENLGRINLPRGKVAVLRMGDLPATANASASSTQTPAVHRAVASGLAPIGTNTDVAAMFRNIGGPAATNLMEQVRGNLLNGASPEANQAFDQLMGGLMSGQINIEDIRQQAQAAADQIRALKRDGGSDPATASLDGYLDILDNFLKETAPAATATNSTIRKPSWVQNPAPARK